MRRIYTDGLEWPQEIEATYKGYSIGRWIIRRRRGPL